jgi:hypothetical protein
MTISQRITALPPAPDPAVHARTEFAQVAAASVLAQRGLPVELNAFATQANDTAADVNARATAAEQASQSAEAAKIAALAAAGAQPWVSGTTYAKNSVAISQVNFQPYRRQVAGAGTVDPANDTAGQWMPLFGNGSFTPRAAASATFDLLSTNFFTRAMSASETWSFANCPTNGFSFAVELTYTGGTLTLPATVKTGNNVVYSFTPGKTYILLFVTTNKGATRWRMAVTEPYDN